MRLKQLAYFFCLFFIFSFSRNWAQNNASEKTLGVNLINSVATPVGKGMKPSQVVLSSVPEKSAVFGQSATFIAYVVATHLPGPVPTGFVVLKIDNVPIAKQSLINGIAKFTTFLSPVKSSSSHHFVTAIYLGDDHYASAQDNMNLVVLPVHTTTSLVANPTPSSFGKPVNFKVTMHAKPPAISIPNGSIQFYVDAISVGLVDLDEEGKASFTYSEMEVGNHAISAIYQGNENFFGSKADLTHQVGKADSTIALTSLDDLSIYEPSVTVQAKVSSSVGIPSGSVQFLVDGVNNGVPIELDDRGQVSLTIQNWLTGTHIVQANYLGDEHFNPSSATLQQEAKAVPTSIDLTSSQNPSLYGELIGIIAKVSSGDLQPMGYVQFKVNGKAVGTAQLLPRNGEVMISLNQLNAGSHEIVADYLGDDNFLPSSKTLVQHVNQKQTIELKSSENPSIYGETIHIIATMKGEEGADFNGVLQLKIEGKDFDKPHRISIGTPAVINITDLNAGSHKIEAILFDEKVGSIKAALIQHIHKAKTEMKLSSASSFTEHESVEVKGTVTAKNLIPKGFIQFNVNEENIGEPQTLSEKGEVVMNLGKLEPGTYQIAGKYLGNENFISSSAIFTLQVNKVTEAHSAEIKAEKIKDNEGSRAISLPQSEEK